MRDLLKDLGLPFSVGDRVLDTVTGFTGKVIGGRAEHTPEQQIIVVLLFLGPRVERTPAELVSLPVTLAVPLDEL